MTDYYFDAIILFGSSIIGHGILTYAIGADLIGHMKLVCTWQMVVYLLGECVPENGISVFSFLMIWVGENS